MRNFLHYSPRFLNQRRIHTHPTHLPERGIFRQNSSCYANNSALVLIQKKLDLTLDLPIRFHQLKFSHVFHHILSLMSELTNSAALALLCLT